MKSGDGVTDDTFGLQLMIALAYTVKKPLYIPMGSYMVTDTIVVGF
jgi:hypothetical protein